MKIKLSSSSLFFFFLIQTTYIFFIIFITFFYIIPITFFYVSLVIQINGRSMSEIIFNTVTTFSYMNLFLENKSTRFT